MTTPTATELTILRRIVAATRGYRTIGSTETAKLRSLRIRGYIEKMPKSRISDPQLWRVTEKGRMAL